MEQPKFLSRGFVDARIFDSTVSPTSLRDPFGLSIWEFLTLKEFEDVINETRKLDASGKLKDYIPYPDQNRHLIGESRDTNRNLEELTGSSPVRECEGNRIHSSSRWAAS